MCMQAALENEWEAILKISEDAGCGNTSDRTAAMEVEKEGHMYAMFDLSRYSPKEAEQNDKEKIRSGKSIGRFCASANGQASSDILHQFHSRK